MVALERRNDIFRTEQDCLRLVEEAKAEATDTIELTLKATADSQPPKSKVEQSLHPLEKRVSYSVSGRR